MTRCFWLITCLCLFSSVAAAQSKSPAGRPLSAHPTIDGGIILRLADRSLSKCINAEKHVISMMLVRMIAEKQSRTWSTDSAVGLVVKTTIEGDDSDQRVQRVTFPRSFLINVADERTGIVSLPVEQRVLSRFNLSKDNNQFTNVELDIKIVRVQEDSDFATAIRSLSKITEELPFPSNPFSEGFRYFAEFGSEIIEQMDSKSKSDDENISDVKINLPFSLQDTCSPIEAKTGSIVVIKQSKRRTANNIDIGRSSSYCYRIIDSPVWSLEFSEPDPEDACNSSKLSWTPLLNPHFVFVLHAAASRRASRPTDTTYAFSSPTADAVVEMPNQFSQWSADSSSTERDLSAIGFDRNETNEYTKRAIEKMATNLPEVYNEDFWEHAASYSTDLLMAAGSVDRPELGMMWEGIQTGVTEGVIVPPASQDGTWQTSMTDFGAESSQYEALLSGQPIGSVGINIPDNPIWNQQSATASSAWLSNIGVEWMPAVEAAEPTIGVRMQVTGEQETALGISNGLIRCQTWGVDLLNCF